jgi:hypothetical protein
MFSQVIARFKGFIVQVEPKQKYGPYCPVVFDIPYTKLYEADGKNEGVVLTADEVSELLDYIQQHNWLDNTPAKHK